MNNSLFMTGDQLIELLKEKEINNKLLDHKKFNAFNQKTILITGATGNLGRQFLPKLIEKLNGKDYKILILSRNNNILNMIKDIINQKVNYYDKELFLKEDGVFVKQADISEIKDLADITDIEWQEVWHLACEVNDVKNIHQLWSSVQSCLNIKKCLSMNSHLYLISSLSVFVSSINSDSQPNYQCTKSQLSSEFTYIGGYAQVKYLSEYIFSDVKKSIIRLGLLVNNNTDGGVLFLKILENKLKSYLKIPSSFINHEVNWTTYEQVVSSLLFLDKKQNFIHLSGSNISLNQWLKKLEHKYNIKFSKVSKQEFLDLISNERSIAKILIYNTFFKKDARLKWPQYYNVDIFQAKDFNFISDIKE